MDKRLNLSQIAELLSGRSGMSKANAEKFVKSFFDIIADQVAAGGTVKIKGLGTFKTIMVEDRESVNVNTGERFVIPGYRKVNFLPDAALKEEVNKPFSAFETVILTDSQAAVLEAMDSENEVVVPVNDGVVPVNDGIMDSGKDGIVPGNDESIEAEIPETVESEIAGTPEKDSSEAIEPENSGTIEPENSVIVDSGSSETVESESSGTPEAVHESGTQDSTAPEIRESIEQTQESANPEVQESVVPEAKESSNTEVREHDKPEKKESGQETARISGPQVREITQKGWVRVVLKLLIWILSLLLILFVLIMLLWPLAGRKLLAEIDNRMKEKTELAESMDYEDELEIVESVSDDTFIPEEPASLFKEETRQTAQTPQQTVPEQIQTVQAPQQTASESRETAQAPQQTVAEPRQTAQAPQQTVPVPQQTVPAPQQTVSVPQPTVTEPQTASRTVKAFSLSPADESKALGLFTAADTVNYRMTGTMAVHQVKDGETLTQIALVEYGTKKLWPYIAAYNGMKNSNALNAGSKILIPNLESK